MYCSVFECKSYLNKNNTTWFCKLWETNDTTPRNFLANKRFISRIKTDLSAHGRFMTHLKKHTCRHKASKDASYSSMYGLVGTAISLAIIACLGE